MGGRKEERAGGYAVLASEAIFTAKAVVKREKDRKKASEDRKERKKRKEKKRESTQ